MSQGGSLEGLFGAKFSKSGFFTEEYVQGTVHGGFLDPHSVLQVSTCNSNDLGYPG